MARKKWTAAEVVDGLRRAYYPPTGDLVTEEWALLTEVPLRAPRIMGGHVHDGYWSNTRTIDVLLVRNWSGDIGHRRIAVEVKVSKSDYRNETDQKRAPAELAAHQTYYAAPVGLIDVASLPVGWGLIEVYDSREAWVEGKGWELGKFGSQSLVRVRKRPVLRDPSCDLDYLTSVAFRRASRAEERIRRGEDDAAAVPGLRREVESLHGKLERRDSQIAKLRGEVSVARSMLAALDGGQVCADCEHPVVLDSRHGYRWVHVEQSQERTCEEARAEVNRVAREAEYGARYMRGWPDPVEPKSLREQQSTQTGAGGNL